jgi:hypothetical protein
MTKYILNRYNMGFNPQLRKYKYNKETQTQTNTSSARETIKKRDKKATRKKREKRKHNKHQKGTTKSSPKINTNPSRKENKLLGKNRAGATSQTPPNTTTAPHPQHHTHYRYQHMIGCSSHSYEEQRLA